jgi:hypothetical protein
LLSFSPPTPDKPEPSPENDVAVTIPTALIPFEETIMPDLAVINPTESIFVTSS